MFACIDKIEILLIKCLLGLGLAIVVWQLILQLPGWSDFLVLLNRLEGIVYSYGGWQ